MPRSPRCSSVVIQHCNTVSTFTLLYNTQQDKYHKDSQKIKEKQIQLKMEINYNVLQIMLILNTMNMLRCFLYATSHRVNLKEIQMTEWEHGHWADFMVATGKRTAVFFVQHVPLRRRLSSQRILRQYCIDNSVQQSTCTCHLI
jgi:hypothetical protein